MEAFCAHIDFCNRPGRREQALQWLALGLTPGLGPTRAHRLVEHFGSVTAVFRASLTELEATGLLAVSAQSLGTGKSLEMAQEESAKATAAGVNVISLDDPTYPPRLKQIYDPPLVLYVRGDVNVLSQPGVAVVGARHPTPYGSGMGSAWRSIWPRHLQWDGARRRDRRTSRRNRRQRQDSRGLRYRC